MLGQEPFDSAGRRGAIVNVASLLSFQGGITVPAYAASKGGVAQLTKALSNEWAGRGVSVNAIAVSASMKFCYGSANHTIAGIHSHRDEHGADTRQRAGGVDIRPNTCWSMGEPGGL